MVVDRPDFIYFYSNLLYSNIILCAFKAFQFLSSSDRVDTAIWMHYMDTD